jgi:hypothetical protein
MEKSSRKLGKDFRKGLMNTYTHGRAEVLP